MKTDTELQRDVEDELRWQPATRDAEIAVAARDGVISLDGYVSSYAQKLSAARAAEGVSGVRAVADELVVKLPNAATRTDTDIAHSAAKALQWNIEVPDTRIKVRVEHGWITLDGTVDWQFQRNAAEHTVRYLTGVKGLFNHIVVRQPTASANDVSGKIADALKRSAMVDASRVMVDAQDGKVVLRGNLRSLAERQDAERAAWAAPGVSVVEDLITVGT